MDAGGGGMGQGTSENKWTPGNDGVRITVIDTESGAAVSTPVDFSNQAQTGTVLHFGKVSKLQYQNGASLQLQAGGSYHCIQPASPMPTIVSSTGRNSIEAIKRYFCSEYACMMVAEAAGMDYDTMISGRYKLMVEPIAYFTHNGQYYCMTATEAALYDQLSGGALRTTMPSLTHKNLALSMFLEDDDLGIGAWTGSTTGRQSNTDIINSLGVGIIWFSDPPTPDDPGGGSPGGGIALPDSDYRRHHSRHPVHGHLPYPGQPRHRDLPHPGDSLSGQQHRHPKRRLPAGMGQMAHASHTPEREHYCHRQQGHPFQGHHHRKDC